MRLCHPSEAYTAAGMVEKAAEIYYRILASGDGAARK